MKLKEVEKKEIMKTFIQSIVEASDEEYQNRVWIEGAGPECDDFDEFVNYFIDESDVILKQYKDFGIADIQYQLLMKFAKEVKKFTLATSRASLPRVFLKSPEWKKIMEMAKEVLKAFNYTDRRKSL